MPTYRQRLVVARIKENQGNIYQAMLDVGYKHQTARNSKHNLVKSKGFQELLEEAGITDEKLTQVLNDGLEAKNYIKIERVEGVGKDRLKTEEIKEVPDTVTRHRYLETGLRLKGHGDKNKETTTQQNTVNIQNNFFDPNSTEAKAIIEQTNALLMKNTKATT